MGALRLTSLCWDSLDHRGWGDAARGRLSHQGRGEKPLSDADLLGGGVRTCLPTVGLLTLVICKLPGDQSPRGKLQGCTTSSWRDSHS